MDKWRESLQKKRNDFFGRMGASPLGLSTGRQWHTFPGSYSSISSIIGSVGSEEADDADIKQERLQNPPPMAASLHLRTLP